MEMGPLDVLDMEGRLSERAMGDVLAEIQARLDACEDEDGGEAETDDKLEEFYESSQIIHRIIVRLEKIEGEPDKNEEELQVQSTLLKCVKTAMQNQVGIDRVTDDTVLVDALALNLDSEDAYICTQVLQLLEVITVSSEEGKSVESAYRAGTPRVSALTQDVTVVQASGQCSRPWIISRL